VISHFGQMSRRFAFIKRLWSKKSLTTFEVGFKKVRLAGALAEVVFTGENQGSISSLKFGIKKKTPTGYVEVSYKVRATTRLREALQTGMLTRVLP
jgi:hypothetical protein